MSIHIYICICIYIDIDIYIYIYIYIYVYLFIDTTVTIKTYFLLVVDAPDLEPWCFSSLCKRWGSQKQKTTCIDLDSSHTRRERASARDSTRSGKLLSQGDQDCGRGTQESSRVHALTPIHTSSVMAAPRRAALSMMLPIFSTLESSAQTISAHNVKATIECSVGSLVHLCLVADGEPAGNSQ